MRFIVQEQLSKFLHHQDTEATQQCRNVNRITKSLEQYSLKLNLPQTTWALACTLFHRYLLNNLLSKQSEAILPAALIFLAAKIDDRPFHIQRCTDLHFQESQTTKNAQKRVICPTQVQILTQKIFDLEFQILCSNLDDLAVEFPYDLLSEAKNYISGQDTGLVFTKAEKVLKEFFSYGIC
jgi:transcription initiation factor TFIIIB Brf1 subunit/transcription initiation factor TFIIB